MKRLILPLCCVLLMMSCGLKVKAPRKKLPDLTEDVSDGWEYRGGWSPAAGDGVSGGIGDGYFLKDTIVGGQSLFALQLPGAGYDSASLSLMRMYEPMSGSVFGLLERYGKKGVVVDLRMNGGSTSRATYSAVGPDGKTLTLILVWDGRSAGREAMLVNELLRTPGIRTSLVKNDMDAVGCFSDEGENGFER